MNVRCGEIAIQVREDHGRPPTPVEALQLAQQATFETRDAKHEPRSLAEQGATWLNEAAAVLGGRSIALVPQCHGIDEPQALRRTNGSRKWRRRCLRAAKRPST
ncbi:MAG: hypothetical protein ACJ72M_05635 [Propionibacteriaceae bacterium]